MKTIYRVLLNGADAGSVIDYWWSSNHPCDITMRRRKEQGKVEMDIDDPHLVASIVNWFKPAEVQPIDIDDDGKASV